MSQLECRFTEEELLTILEQSSVYDCACPAQVCNQIRSLRRLYAYQAGCLNRTDIDVAVHRRIAADTLAAHATLEQCLEAILALEGWDRQTLKMPESFKKRLMKAAGGDK